MRKNWDPQRLYIKTHYKIITHFKRFQCYLLNTVEKKIKSFISFLTQEFNNEQINIDNYLKFIINYILDVP